MKYLKHIQESEKAFDFGYEREIVEDFIEEMNEFGIKSYMIIHTTSGKKFKTFDDFIIDRQRSNQLYKNGNYFINIQGEVDKKFDFGNESAFKTKSNLAKDQYDYIKGLIDDFIDKMHDLTDLKVLEVGLNADIRYYISKGKSEELYSNLRYVITTKSNKSMKSK